EDGIRDRNVTGVQTCALPISSRHHLLFGPDTATTDRCMLGGMIGNNSCGLFSIKHRTTREHILEIEAVLSDGSRVEFRPLTETEIGRASCREAASGREQERAE